MTEREITMHMRDVLGDYKQRAVSLRNQHHEATTALAGVRDHRLQSSAARDGF